MRFKDAHHSVSFVRLHHRKEADVSFRPIGLRLEGDVCIAGLLGLLMIATASVGCGQSKPSVVQETQEMSFDDVTAQLAAEEAASVESRSE